jgi:hypothetical protein
MCLSDGVPEVLLKKNYPGMLYALLAAENVSVSGSNLPYVEVVHTYYPIYLSFWQQKIS